MMKPLVIVGYSGFSREIMWLVEKVNAVHKTWEILGFVDKTVRDGVIGDDSYLMGYDKGDLDVVIAVGDTTLRSRLYQSYRNNTNLSFPSVIDPSVLISGSVRYGMGNIICAGSILTVDISIGDFNIINLDCTIGHEVVMEDFVTLNPSVNLSGNSYVECHTNIGTGSQVLQGIRIGRNSTIGAGAVVNKDVPQDCVAVGVPARVIKHG